MNFILKKKPFLVAEVGQSHHGNFDTVKEIIKTIGSTKVDAIKFQTHFADSESTFDEPFRSTINIKKNLTSRYKYWESVQFTEKQWIEISKLVKKQNKFFLSSPFSLKGLHCLLKTNMKAIKIGSGEFFSQDLINSCLNTRLPIIISTGLSNISEIKKMIMFLKKKKKKFIILQCNTSYPTKLEEIGVNYIRQWKKKYNCNVGISIHSNLINPSSAAITNGADLIEMHVKINEDEFNPDNSSSITIDQLNQICEFREDFNKLTSNNVKKKLTNQQEKLKRIFTKSICLKNDKPKNYIIKKRDIIYKKPGYGFGYKDEQFIIGKKLLKKVTSNRILKIKDIKR